MQESKRIVSFDILKGIGILAVILGHVDIPQTLKTVIYSFHMPLFFFVSGCFFRNVSWREFLTKRTRQILVPWAFFAFLWFAYLFVLNLYSAHDVAEAFSVPVASVLDGFLGDENSLVLFRSIWFLICLFEVSAVYLLLSKIVTGNKMLIISIVCLLLHGGGIGWGSNGVNLPYFIDTAMSVLIFYHLGFCFTSNGWHKKKVSPAVSLPMFAAAVVFVILFPFHVELKFNIFPPHLLGLSMAIVLSMWWIVDTFLRGGEIGKMLAWCGANSLVLFGLHGLFLDVAGILIGKLNCTGYVATILSLALTLPLCCLATILINRYIPFVLGRPQSKTR